MEKRCPPYVWGSSPPRSIVRATPEDAEGALKVTSSIKNPPEQRKISARLIGEKGPTRSQQIPGSPNPTFYATGEGSPCTSEVYQDSKEKGGAINRLETAMEATGKTSMIFPATK